MLLSLRMFLFLFAKSNEITVQLRECLPLIQQMTLVITRKTRSKKLRRHQKTIRKSSCASLLLEKREGETIIFIRSYIKESPYLKFFHQVTYLLMMLLILVLLFLLQFADDVARSSSLPNLYHKIKVLGKTSTKHMPYCNIKGLMESLLFGSILT